jgi:hypothetical protein
MIIKNMSRKKDSFAQLMEYVTREEMTEGYEIYHNTFGMTPAEVTAEFQENASHLRNKGVYNTLYHEIHSITRAERLSLEEQKNKLKEIAELWIAKRAEGNIAFAALHDDKEDNLHYHIVISANKLGSIKRNFYKKASYNSMRVEHEKYVLETYPELEQKIAIGKKSQDRKSQEAIEMMKRTGRMPKREEVLERLDMVFSSSDLKQTVASLEAQGLYFYKNGKNFGVQDTRTGKNYRLKKLDVMGKFEEFRDRVQLVVTKKDVIRKVRSDKYSREEKEKKLQDAIARKKDKQEENIPIKPIETPAVQQENIIHPVKIPEKPVKVIPETSKEPEINRHRARPEPEEVLDVEKEEALTHRKGIFEKIRNRMGRKKDKDYDRDH